MDLGYAIIGGAVGGAIVLLLEQVFIYIRESNKEKKALIITHRNTLRTITGDIFNQLGPGSSLDLMRQDLGSPNKKGKESTGLLNAPFLEGGEQLPEASEITYYLYFFKNAAVKITSEDGETVTSLTVMGSESDIDFSTLYYWDGEQKAFLNVATIDEYMLEYATVEEFPGCRDSFTAVHKQIGNPFWIYQTLFCLGADYREGETDVSTNPNLIIGREISGICLSTSAETASYIYTTEHTSGLL